MYSRYTSKRERETEMQTWIKEALKNLTAEQDAMARDIYIASFDASTPQLREILRDLETNPAGLPDVAVDALTHVLKAAISDRAYVGR